MLTGILGALAPVASELIDQLFETDEEKAAAQARLVALERQGRLETLKVRQAAILAEAKSADPWTSRARPSFLYVIYLYILAAIPFGILFALAPETAAAAIEGVEGWLAAIPDALWAVFATGYLGYTAARSADKRGILTKLTKGGL